MPVNMNEYANWLNGIAKRYRHSQIKAAISVNTEMLKFYWSLGADIVRLEKDQPWGSKFMQRLSLDLKVSMPDATCFSRTNLKYIRRFYLLYRPSEIGQQVADQLEHRTETAEIVQQAAEQLPLSEFTETYPNVSGLIFSVPWGHHMVIIDKLCFRTVYSSRFQVTIAHY